MNNIIENNKLIAEFMGGYEPEEFEDYHSDWNWLMEVVEKIENYNEYTNVFFAPEGCAIDCHIENGFSFSNDCDTKIEAVYSVCIEFIKWYNKQSKCEKIDSGEIDTDDEKSTFLSFIVDKYNMDFDDVREFTDEHYENLLSEKDNETKFVTWYNKQK